MQGSHTDWRQHAKMLRRNLQGARLHMCKKQGFLEGRKDIAYIWVAGKNLVHRAAEKKRPVS